MTEVTTQRSQPPLEPDLNGIPAALSHPRAVAIACIVTLCAAGWLYLGLVTAQYGGAAYLDALCRPLLEGRTPGPGAAALVLAMWVAMTLAMMLPSAGPMIVTYAEIAETAARKGERIVSPLVLSGGYLVVWLGFALAATLAQLALMALATKMDVAPFAAPATVFLFFAAGFYQFSQLKHACLRACQNPFPFFFANWTDKSAGVFRLGVRQGLYCLGCCWAMMLLMFVSGSMNVVWMVLLGIVMVIEKMSATARFSHVVGALLFACGLLIAMDAAGGPNTGFW